jgi:hypothetical protein
MDEQTVFDATAQKLYTEYIDADNVLAHAQCARDAADFIAACETAAEATDFPQLLVPVETGDQNEVATDCHERQIDEAGVRKLFIAARCLNEVLKPQMFKSDWRFKMEKKAFSQRKTAEKMDFGGVNKSKKSSQHIRNEIKKEVAERGVKDSYYANKRASDWKIGNKYKRQRGASMTDNAM